MSGGEVQRPRIERKWRPSIGLIVFLVLMTVLSLPLIGVFFFRIYENRLVRETEAELIAQSVVIAVLFRQEIETGVPADVPLGVEVRTVREPASADPYEPITPTLDLASDDLLARRPDAQTPAAPPHPAFLAIGARLAPKLLETQRVTLAGFRLLDANGVVIAGREEVGRSLAHVEEVAEALHGRFRSVVRLRVSEHEPPPLYSMSRGTGVRVFIAMPVIVRDHVAGVVYASRTPSNVFKHLYEERGRVVVAALSIVTLTLLIGFVFHRTITSPMYELIARTGAIAAGDRRAMRSLSRHGTAEFARLSQSFLDMAASLHNRSDFISTFAAHVSHELKSPLTSIQGAAELMRDDIDAPLKAMSDADRRGFLDSIVADVSRMTAVVHRLRELARAESSPTAGVTTLGSVIAEIASTFAGLQIEASGDMDCAIRMSAENANIVLSHLADNAVRHGATKLHVASLRETDLLRVTVLDNGDGVSRNNRSRIFDSFFTTRRESGGTGMGLAIVRSMLHAHGGAIHLLECDKGAAFELNFPLAQEGMPS